MLGLKENDGKEYWLEIEIEDSTPDVYGSFLDMIETNAGKKAIRENFFSIEIVELEKHTINIVKLIKDKCHKSYSTDYFLLAHVRKGGEILEYEKIYKKIEKL